MAATKYTYSIQDDFPNHRVATDRLLGEIRTSSIVTAVDFINTSEDDCDIHFKQELSLDDKQVLDAIVSAHSGDPLPQPGYEADGTPIMSLRSKQADGIPVFAEAPRDGSEWVVGSHNFCDPCSWFGDSVRLEGDALTDSGDGLTFTSSHVNWIDMVTGRMHNDDMWCLIQKILNPLDPHGYQVIVKVDGIVKTPCPPFTETGGDYWIDWDAGNVVFLAPQTGKDVAASYSYATTNTFYLRPMPGTILAVEDAECDVSSDVEMTTDIAYSAWHFDGTEYVRDMEARYKRAREINVEARGCYPVFQPIGASAAHKQIADIKEFRRKSRGMKYSNQGAPFQYSTVKWLRAAALQEVRVYTKDSLPFDGEHVSITFYCTERSE